MLHLRAGHENCPRDNDTGRHLYVPTRSGLIRQVNSTPRAKCCRCSGARCGRCLSVAEARARWGAWWRATRAGLSQMSQSAQPVTWIISGIYPFGLSCMSRKEVWPNADRLESCHGAFRHVWLHRYGSCADRHWVTPLLLLRYCCLRYIHSRRI